VPDPYGAGADEFARVFDLIAAAAKGLVAELAAMFDGAGDG
jgi:protein-tyrosine-phosphatase